MKILLIIIAVIYVLLPYDLVPDFLAGWGWLDDLTVLFILWRIYRALQRPAGRQGTYFRQQNTGRTHNRQAHDGRQQQKTASENNRPQDPYAILEVTPDASTEEIKTAYHKLAAKYHPDKVMYLGEEFRELAEQRFKEIQNAYQQIMSDRGK